MQRGVFVLRESVAVDAPMERCFLLATSLAIVEEDLKMRPAAGRGVTRTQGLATGGDRIRWRGWKFGLPQVHVSLISEFEPYRFFQDRMVRGRFRSFAHDHEFVWSGGRTVMKDTVRFSLPGGFLGRWLGRRVLAPYIRGLLGRRMERLKALAESEEWRRYLPAGDGAGTDGRRAP